MRRRIGNWAEGVRAHFRFGRKWTRPEAARSKGGEGRDQTHVEGASGMLGPDRMLSPDRIEIGSVPYRIENVPFGREAAGEQSMRLDYR